MSTQQQGPMTKDEFFARMQEVYNSNVQLSMRKNADYAGESDPFKNFRVCETLGIPVESGLIVRMSDKIARISNLLGGAEAKVTDESVTDTLRDLANYAIITLLWIENKRRTQK